MRSPRPNDDKEKEELTRILRKEVEDLRKAHSALEDLVESLKEEQWESQ